MPAVALEAARRLSEQVIWPALLHTLWAVLLVASCAALVLHFGLRLSHRSRHSMLMAALLAAVIGPIGIAAWQRIALCQQPIREPENLSVRVSTQTGIGPRFGLSETGTSEGSQVSESPGTTVRHSLDTAGFRKGTAGLVRKLRPFALSAWLLGVFMLSVILALGSRQVLRICRESVPASRRVRRRCRDLAREFQILKVPDVRVHTELSEPCLCGVVRPVILLPERWITSSPDEQLDAILAHELAHARRRDHLVNLGQRLVEIALFYHPALHWISRALRRERELCTDAMAIRITRNPLALAGALESVGRFSSWAPARSAMGATLGGESFALLSRIKEILGMKPSPPRLSLWPFAAIPATAVLALVAVTAGLADEPAGSIVPLPAEGRQPPSTAAGVVAPSGAPSPSLPPTPVDLQPFGPFPAGPHSEVRARLLPAPQTDRLVSFEVRFISLDANPWRNRLSDKLKLVKQDGDVSAWILDAPALTDLLKQMMSESASNLVQAPKVTIFENGVGTIESCGKRPYVASLENVGKPGQVALLPHVGYVDVGTQLQISGSRTERGTRLTLDLKDSAPTLHALVRNEAVRDQVVRVPYQVPTVIERRCRLSHEVPETSSLLISLGLQDRSGRLPRAAETVIGVLADLGPPRVEARVTTERLVLITPKWTVLEPEERPVAAPVRREASVR